MCKTIIQQDFIAKINKTKLWQENISKSDVELTKSNGEFYLYLYRLGIYFKEISQLPTHMWPMFTLVCLCAPMCGPCSPVYAHVHLCVANMYPYVNYEWNKSQLKMNQDLTKSELKFNQEWIESYLKWTGNEFKINLKLIKKMN
jgi:hypothetical protein